MLCDGQEPEHYFQNNNTIQDILKVKFNKFKHTILMKFGRPLAIIVYYTVQLNLECCKSSVPDMGPNTTFKIKKIYIKRRLVLKVKLKKSQHTIFIKFGRPLVIIVHYTVQFNLECCKSSVPDMSPNTIFKIIIKFKTS